MKLNPLAVLNHNGHYPHTTVVDWRNGTELVTEGIGANEAQIRKVCDAPLRIVVDYGLGPYHRDRVEEQSPPQQNYLAGR